MFKIVCFWDKSDKQDTIVISTHGIIKKTDKTPKVEIERAESLRVKYFNEKE
ncbi:type II toxin-antitoxin system RelE/ParE family toxin [Flavobacterium pygoscelis]|uniref:type II toxin-antitoxin system RelE/ParE family toxin n=1 Tax=Flavobacterium pygoscelis TaxID=2893176 RepID=UPI0031F34476